MYNTTPLFKILEKKAEPTSQELTKDVKFLSAYIKLVNSLKKIWDTIPSTDKEKNSIKNILKTPFEKHNPTQIKKVLGFLQKYRTHIDPLDRIKLTNEIIHTQETLPQQFKTHFGFNLEDFSRTTISEIVKGKKQLQQIKEAYKETKEKLEQVMKEYEETKKQLEGTQEQLKQKEQKLETTKEKLLETAKKLGVTAKQLKETQETLSQETERKRALGRVIRYGVPGVGGLTAGYLFGPILGPILGGGSGILTNLAIQAMQGDSLKDWRAYAGPVGVGIGTGLVGSLFKHIVEKRRRNIKNE